MRKQIVLCCLLCLLCVPVASAAIVFKKTGDGSGIYVMDDKGADVTLLTGLLKPAASRWSPNGKQIVFQRGENSQSTHLSIMNADGTNIRDLTPPSREKRYVHPFFSPDGKYIVFRRYDRFGKDDRNHVMMIHLTTGRLKEISKLGINHPEFSPDGKHIIFSTIPRVGVTGDNIWIMKANGGDPRALLPSPPDNDLIVSRSLPRWSPDGRHILYTEDHDTLAVVDNVLHYIPQGYYYFICDRNGKNIKKLNIPNTLRPVGRDWMKDGKAIVFTAREAVLKEPPIDLEQVKMYTYHIGSGKLMTLYVPPDGNAYSLDWISDDVLSVTPQGQKKVPWGELKQ